MIALELGYLAPDGMYAGLNLQHYQRGQELGSLTGFRAGYTFKRRDWTNLNEDRNLLQVFAGPSFLLRSTDKPGQNAWVFGAGVKAFAWKHVSFTGEYINGSFQVTIGVAGWL